MRREFPKEIKRQAHKRSQGICECGLLALAGIPGFSAEGCGQPLGTGNTFYEHVIPDGAGGRPTLDNCAVLVKTCWKKKTNTFDQGKVAKTLRITDRAKGIGRRTGAPLPGTRASGIRKRFNGNIERWS